MGYTHYWSKEGTISQTAYAKAYKDMIKVVKDNENILANGMGDIGTKPTYRGKLSFNGVGEESHETFSVPSQSKDLKSFDFCKTARKEYDLVVVACLTILHNYCPGMSILSDGDKSELMDGLHLAQKILKKEGLVSIADEVPSNAAKFIEAI